MTDPEYPTEDDIKRLVEAAHFNHTDASYEGCTAALALMKSLWWSADVLWEESSAFHDITGKVGTLYDVSTGGWSGNEELIEAVHQTFMWTLVWESSRRGGHYTFFVPAPKEATDA